MNGIKAPNAGVRRKNRLYFHPENMNLQAGIRFAVHWSGFKFPGPFPENARSNPAVEFRRMTDAECNG
jgi:hypothetical protein